MSNAAIIPSANGRTYQSRAGAFEAPIIARASRGGSGTTVSSVGKASASLYSASPKSKAADRDSRTQDCFYRKASHRAARSVTTIRPIDRRLVECDCGASVGSVLATRRAWQRLENGTLRWSIVLIGWVFRSWPRCIGRWCLKDFRRESILNVL